MTSRLLQGKPLARAIAIAATAAISVFAGGNAMAQATNAANLSNGFAPYAGISGGRAVFDEKHSIAALKDNKNGTMFKAYGGAMFTENLGMELSYLHFGKIQHGSDKAEASGVDLSFVAKAPLGDRFDVFGKIGGTYGWTKSSVSSPEGVLNSKDSGMGLSYGAGASFYFTPQIAATLEYQRHGIKFTSAKSNIETVTVGLRYNF